MQLRTIEEIFHAALEQETTQVGTFLETACGGDESLREEVETLVSSHNGAGIFLAALPAALVAQVIQAGQRDLLVNQTVGHYKILEQIGVGGMGEVYLAWDVTAGRKAALKILPPRFTAEPARLRRFQQEAHAVVALNHPNILTIYEIGAHDSSHYIASELIEGETLRQRLASGPMKPEEAIDVTIQVAAALAAAHHAGIVHRDIKPENIMLRPDGYVKVLDFGIAKLAEGEGPQEIAQEGDVTAVETSLGAVMGTVSYMSPEQVRGESVDQRSDIWSLGVVLYEMIAARPPFTGNQPREIMASILEASPSLLSSSANLPAELKQTLHKAMSKERASRYQTAQEFLDALKNLRRGIDFQAERQRVQENRLWRRWFWPLTAAASLLLITALALLPSSWRHPGKKDPIPDKSIAVLPFQNLSDSKDNSGFGAGIQDDLLTSLAKIHDLKVISRTSVMAYQKPDGRDIRAIGRALGVANILEGSVRRAGNRVLVNVQLIDARNDQHLWAERYDRTVADSIGLQGELATQIAAALKATLAPGEKARLDTGPTTNSEAYVLYLTALGKQTDEIAAEQLCVQATTLDPKFALAYARASLLNSGIAGYQEPRTRRAKARAQAEEALRLSPSLGEAHAALALCLYWGEKNYDAALKEFEIAAAASPNNAEIHTYVGGIYRRQGRWREATASFDRAVSLDPRNVQIALFAANHRLFMRDWPGAIVNYNHLLKVSPDSVIARVALAYLEVCRNGNPAAGKKILENIPVSHRALTTWNLAMLERDYARAEQALSHFSPDDLANGSSKEFYAGRTALARGDLESAQRCFAAATPAFEMQVREAPDDPQSHGELGLLYAYMQRREDSIRESRRAVELAPESQDAFHGALQAANLALVYALVGDQEEAITLLERLLSTPGPVSFPGCPQSITLAELRLGSQWDSLRSNPRFQDILAGPEPATVYR